MPSQATLLSAALAFVLAATGCASSRRMMDVSPMGENGPTLDPERVNAFPFYYGNRDRHSVLWPIVDWDDHGWAVRPLYNRHGDDHSILFPLSGWNPKEGSGWVVPAWWDKEGFCVVPLCGQGRQNWFVLPFFRWRTDQARPSTLLFPVGGWGEDWWNVGPFCRWDIGSKKTSHNLLFPVAYWNKDSFWLAELFYWHEGNVTREWRSVLGILGRGERRGETDKWWALPLLTYREHSHGEFTHVTFPLWWQFSDKNTESCTFAPFFFQRKSKQDGFECLMTPLGGYGGDGTGNRKLAVLGPLYWDYRDPAHRLLNIAGAYYRWDDTHYVLFGLGKVDTGGKGTSWRAWPLAGGSDKERGEPGFFEETAMFWHGKDEVGTHWHCWPLLAWGNRTKTAKESCDSSHWLLGLVGGAHEDDQYATTDSWNRLVWHGEKKIFKRGEDKWDFLCDYHYSDAQEGRQPGQLTAEETEGSLFIRTVAEEWRVCRDFQHPNDDSWTELGHWLTHPEGPAWKKERDIPWKWMHRGSLVSGPVPAYPSARRVRAILEKAGVRNLPAESDLSPAGTSAKDRERLETALRAGVRTGRSSLAEFSLLRILPLWHRDTREEDGGDRRVDDHALFGFLWDYESSREKTDFRLLWRMYERERTGTGDQETVRRNIFPFIRWDDAPEEHRVSFLWRVFDWRKDKDGRRSGHFLFIPW